MDSDRPYLSIVIASRNDGYANGMLHRIQVCVDSIFEQLEQFEHPSELILVDWNPPAERGLWDALQRPKSVRRCTFRLITVPPKLHATLPFADRLPILIHRARNVGIRRARGQFILPTSPDILLSDELAEWFGKRQMDSGHMYRLARHDVPVKALEYDSREQRLIYCREHVYHVNDRASSYRQSKGLPDLFTNAAGDFTVLSRDMYFRLRGIPEEREFHSMHFDSVFCFMAHAAGAMEVELTDPLRIYHVDHGAPSWRPRASLLERSVTRVLPRGGVGPRGQPVAADRASAEYDGSPRRAPSGLFDQGRQGAIRGADSPPGETERVSLQRDRLGPRAVLARRAGPWTGAR